MKNLSNEFIVTNFAYGTGPYLRTTELAIAFNEELEKRGHDRFRIIVPLVYGNKQKRIMSEEFSAHTAKYPREIVFDEKLGGLLKKIFYDGNSPYEYYLDKWLKTVKPISFEIKKYLTDKYGDSIKAELNRSPRVSYNIAPSYFTSFGYIGEILEETRKIGGLGISPRVLDLSIEKINSIEKKQKLHCLAFPGTFSYSGDRKPRYLTEKEVPPLVTPPPLNLEDKKIDKGIFVTVSGIPGLEKMYSVASKLNSKIYSNNPHAIPGSIKVSPKIIASKKIILHFARAGWNSVWLSLMSGTPLVLPEFDPSDDPEIYFNSLAIKKLGIGVVYNGQTTESLLEECEGKKNKILAVKKKIFDRWSIFDGTKYCARLFVSDLLNNR